jgi:hypothetical protein
VVFAFPFEKPNAGSMARRENTLTDPALKMVDQRRQLKRNRR